MPNQQFAGATAFPVSNDLHIENQTSQGIYYNVYGNSPNRTIVFEFNATVLWEKQQNCHFQVLFFEAHLGIVQFIYLNMSDDGSSAAVGVQGKSVYE